MVPSVSPVVMRALLIEPQMLFAPFFAATLTAAGYDRIEAVERVEPGDAFASGFDTVVIDSGSIDEPLQIVRAMRARFPAAKIVLYAHTIDTMWEPLARSLGADVLIGPRADEADLRAAIAFAV